MQNPNDALLLLGLKENKIVSIHDVPNGLDCGCFCPKCNSPLIAKNNGKIKQAHFAHSNPACVGSVESAIHLLAKEILFEEKEIFIPSFYKYFKVESKPVELIKSNKLVKFSLVFYEQIFSTDSSSIIVDTVCLQKGQILLVEFANTHFVDENKLWILKVLGHSCLEIDLANGSQIKEELKLQLKSNFFKATWLVNKRGELEASEYKKRLQQVNEKLKALENEKLKLEIEKRNEYKIKMKEYADNSRKAAESKGTIVAECPVFMKLFEQYANTKYGNHELIKKLLIGDWNGVIYEKENFTDLFIDGERFFIFPENYNDLNDSEKSQCAELRRMVELFRSFRESFSGKPCAYCNLFRGYYDGNRFTKHQNFRLICGYKEGMDLEKHFVFPAKF